MCEKCAEFEAKYLAPPGKKWKFIGSCACKGQDMACVDDDSLWELVDDAQSARES